MLRRTCFVLLLGLILAISVARSPTSTASPSAGGADVTSAGGFDKITGTVTGTYHHSFPDYYQTYDAVTKAQIVWEEDPDFLLGCHCRAFFPAPVPVPPPVPATSGIDWTWHYADDTCNGSDAGHVEAGAGLTDRTDQMLVLWEDPNDPGQYLFSGNGLMFVNTFINCDGAGNVAVPDFLHIPEPEHINTSTPAPLAAAFPAASIPSCEGEPFKVARDATRLSGSCYEGYQYDEYDYVKYEWDFNLAPEPIIFIHGFLGSKMSCGATELWPNIPPGPKFPQMLLAADGTSPAPGACAASVGDILDTVLGSNIYKEAVDYLNHLEPGNVFFFNWDWRSGPQQSLAALDSFIGFIRAAHANSKVVIMAHSYGGLLARLYVNDSTRADKVARVLTVGTPAWGSPKALFPLYAGVETPEFSPLDLLMDNDDLHQFARNLLGAYFLYPSLSYGPWLKPDPSSNMPVDQQGLLNYVSLLGGNTALLDQALNLHSSTLDAPYIAGPSGPRFEVIVGTGLPTISGVRVLPLGYLSVEYGNGDGTVPARSAARGALGSSNPNKAHTHYSCRVDHVALPGDHQVTDAIDDFLQFGDDIKGLTAPCSFSGVQFRLFHLPPLPASASGSGLEPAGTSGSSGALSIEDAVLQGKVDYLDLPNEKFVITGTEFPEVALPQAKFLEVTPLSDDTKGQPMLYGPLDGQITISAGADGPVVLVNGDPAPLDGDVNCDGKVTALDALLLVLHAGGTPMSPTASCAPIGSGADPFGDVDCDHSVTAMDGLADLRIVAGVSLSFLAGCQ
jgi:pimeloyl-ACP methyl ester carboxylesterase